MLRIQMEFMRSQLDAFGEQAKDLRRGLYQSGVRSNEDAVPVRVMHVTLLSNRLKRLQIHRQKMLATGRGALFSCELVCPNAADRL